MSGRFADPRVVDLSEATAELKARRRILRDNRRKSLARKLRRLPISRSALWVAGFYATLGACTALWWHWDDVGLPRLLMGSVLLVAVLLAIGREVVATHPVWMLLPPAAIVVAAFFWYPLAPTAAILALVLVIDLVVRMKMRSLLAGFCASGLLSGGVARADVWEFDRQGNMLRSPSARDSDNNYYDENVFGGDADTPVSQSTRNVNSAIYEPMAEGVAEVYAADPAVAGAGLDEEDFVRLFVALIDQESRFNPTAVSPKGARGLGQLMPETAALLGVDSGEPMANLHGAARYLTAQLAAFGRVDLALAAYNAGPQRVEQFHGIPPFRETRDYVAKITAAAELAGDVPAAARAPRPAVARAFASPSTPALETDVVEPVSLAAPAQGTVLEWKR